MIEPTEGFVDGFLDKVPLDPWKQPYEYVSPGTTDPYAVLCLGGDGRAGGEGENQDFSSESPDVDG